MCWNLELEIELNTNRHSFYTRPSRPNTGIGWHSLCIVSLVVPFLAPKGQRTAPPPPPSSELPCHPTTPASHIAPIRRRVALPSSHSVGESTCAPPLSLSASQLVLSSLCRWAGEPCRPSLPLLVSCAALPSLRRLAGEPRRNPHSLVSETRYPFLPPSARGASGVEA
jgi:hypothetical protein